MCAWSRLSAVYASMLANVDLSRPESLRLPEVRVVRLSARWLHGELVQAAFGCFWTLRPNAASSRLMHWLQLCFWDACNQCMRNGVLDARLVASFLFVSRISLLLST
eukprot:6179975-Pleurochrysis_carterae.AAC.3